MTALLRCAICLTRLDKRKRIEVKEKVICLECGTIVEHEVRVIGQKDILQDAIRKHVEFATKGKK